MELIIENLSKTYPNGTQALKNVSLNIQQGMFGLLGPNGAGKSSLMRTIAGLQEADSGKIQFGDLDLKARPESIRPFLGYLPQEFGVYDSVSAEDLLNHLALLKGVTNAGERKNLIASLLEKTNLTQHRKKNVSSYSGGMKQRFGIAQALIGNPKLLIVDEPTAGLDPAERNRFLNLLCELGDSAVVILSTHIVEDVRELCTQMAIINHGEVILKGAPEEAVNALEGKIWLKKIGRGDLESHKQKFTVLSEKMLGGMPEICAFAEQNPGDGFRSKQADLEDVYFSKIYQKATL